MHRSTVRDRHSRRPAVEKCENRLLQSIIVESVGNKATQPQELVFVPDSSRTVVLYKPTPAHASAIFDDPFFFDPN